MEVERGQRAEIVVDQQHSHAFEPARMTDGPDVDRVQVEALHELSNPGFGSRVVPCQGDRDGPARGRRIDHVLPAQHVERLDDMGVRRGGLDDLAIGRIDTMADLVVGEVERVGRIDDDLAGKVAEIAGDLAGKHARNRQDDDVGADHGFGLRCRAGVATGALQQLLHGRRRRVARAVDDLVALGGKLGAERAADPAGANDRNHVSDSAGRAAHRHEEQDY